MYNNLSELDKAIAKFGDRVAILASLEISGKIGPEKALSEIKSLYKDLKATYKAQSPNKDA